MPLLFTRWPSDSKKTIFLVQKYQKITISGFEFWRFQIIILMVPLDSQHYCECNGTTPTSLWYWNHADTFLPNVWWSRDTAEDSGIPGRISLIPLYLRNSLDVQLWFEPKNTTNGHRIGEIQPRELCAIFAGNAKLVFFANSSHQNVRPWPLIT